MAGSGGRAQVRLYRARRHRPRLGRTAIAASRRGVRSGRRPATADRRPGKGQTPARPVRRGRRMRRRDRPAPGARHAAKGSGTNAPASRCGCAMGSPSSPVPTRICPASAIRGGARCDSVRPVRCGGAAFAFGTGSAGRAGGFARASRCVRDRSSVRGPAGAASGQSGIAAHRRDDRVSGGRVSLRETTGAAAGRAAIADSAPEGADAAMKPTSPRAGSCSRPGQPGADGPHRNAAQR